MANIPIDAIFNQAIYAKSRINKFAYPGGNSIGVIDPGNIIGKIYSYVVYNGSVYWMIDDIFGSQTFFVKHDPINLNLPNKQAILNDIAAKAEAQKLQDKGIVQYNIDKYLPYIIGAGVIVMAAPSIIAAISNKKINGMAKGKKSNKALLLLAAGVAAYMYFGKKKTKAGTPIIETIDEGFVNEMQSASVPASMPTPESAVNITPVQIADSFGNMSTIPAIQTIEPVTNYSGGGGGYIDYVGPFKAVYDQPANMVSGTRKGNIGKLRTC